MEKRFKTFLFLLIGVCFQLAADTYDGIYAWVDGSSTCYKLESMPEVTYGDGKATLNVGGYDVLTLTLSESKNLIITYGSYKPTAISYTLNKSGYGTLILPYDAEVPDGMSVYKVTGQTNGLVNLEKQTAIKACMPYVIYCEDVTAYEDPSRPILSPSRKSLGLVQYRTFTFSGMPINMYSEYADGYLVGELASCKAPYYDDSSDSIAYVLQIQNDEVGFYQVTRDNITVGANRCYFRMLKSEANNVRALFFDFEDKETGIAEVTSDYNDKVYRDGKFIRGGHVIIIKNGKQYDADGTPAVSKWIP